MRDVTIVTTIYSILFIILTLPSDMSFFGMSAESSMMIHHFLADITFWAGALYICASGSFGALARQDRFGLSQDHPMANRLLSLLLLFSPFLAMLWNVRFVYVLLGLLFFSHIRSKTLEESKISFSSSRAMSNLALIPLFAFAMMFMSWNGYSVSSIFNFGSTTESDKLVADTTADQTDLKMNDERISYDEE